VAGNIIFKVKNQMVKSQNPEDIEDDFLLRIFFNAKRFSGGSKSTNFCTASNSNHLSKSNTPNSKQKSLL